MITEKLQNLKTVTAAHNVQRIADAKIVIIDDEPLILELFDYYLSTAGFENVHTFSSSVDAIECLKLMTPDLILTDIQMPEVQGGFLVRLLRHDQRFANVPLIAITSDTSDETHEQLIRNGVSAVMHKPVVAEKLIAIATLAIQHGPELNPQTPEI